VMLRDWRRRGSVDAQARVLLALKHADDWCFGLDLMRTCRMRAGRLYPALMRLEEHGLVQAIWQEGDRPRRMYRYVGESTP